LNDGAARFARCYPTVWHVIEADGAGPWLAETGLLPAIELHHDRANRDAFLGVDLGNGGRAVLRPQQMPDHRLLPSLGGAYAGQPDLWRRHVDHHVFFWAEKRRRDSFLNACIRLRSGACKPPVVLEVDTATLLMRHAEIAFFAQINVGSTVRGGARARRDQTTLRPASDYRSGAVAELAIRGRVDLNGVVRRNT
jgi:hypothetical protein